MTEIRNSKQSASHSEGNGIAPDVLNIWFLNFDIVSDFEIRISDFSPIGFRDSNFGFIKEEYG